MVTPSLLRCLRCLTVTPPIPCMTSLKPSSAFQDILSCLSPSSRQRLAMKKTAFFTSQSNGEGGGTASASTNQSDQLPDVRLSHEPQDVKHNLVALMDFMDKGWVREKPMVAESAMHLDGMSISCWRQLLSTPGALLKRVSFVIPCAKARDVARARHYMKTSVAGQSTKAKTLEHKDIEIMGDDQRIFFEEVELVSGKVKRVMYSCFVEAGKGVWVMMQWPTDHDSYRELRTASSKQLNGFRTWICSQQDMDVMVTFLVCHIYPKDILSHAWITTTLALSGDFMASMAVTVAEQCSMYLNPEPHLKFQDLKNRCISSPYDCYAISPTVEEYAASMRATLMARGVDELNWQELDRTQDIKMYWCKHLNSVHSVMMETVLKHIDAASLANLLFHEDGQEAVSLGWDVRNISIANDGMRTISRTPNNFFRDMCVAGGEVQEMIEKLIVSRRRHGDGRLSVSTWRVDRPDNVQDDTPNFWTIWLLAQQGLHVNVKHASFARHTYVAQVELQTGKGSVQAIEEATRVKFRQASVTGDYPQAAKLPRHHDVAMVDTCAERVLFLKKLLECEDGIEMMSHHASGIKGMLLHGPGSCLAGAMVRCCAAQCEPRDLTLGPPALTHRLSGKFY